MNTQNRNQSHSRGTLGGIVLCGGRSRRMGQPKHMLPFGDELMLPRVCRLVAEVASPICVVAASGQELPKLHESIAVVCDQQPDHGPLAGLAAGLKFLESETDFAFASACDTPLLNPNVISFLFDRIADCEVLMCEDGRYQHPLCAVYRTHLGRTIDELLEAGMRRPVGLLERCESRRISLEDVREVDPNLDSFRNTNTPDDYNAALRVAGFDETGFRVDPKDVR